MKRAKLVLAIWFLVLSGCTTTLRPPNLGRLYDRTAQAHQRYRNPVIVIPGILGTRLVHGSDGQTVWGAFGGEAANPETAEGARLVALPVVNDGQTLAELRDDVRPDGVLDRARVNLLGLPIELNAYIQILSTLGVGGYRDELLGENGSIDYGEDHYTCFQFDYDWRRDNVENAARLKAFIEEKKAYVAERRAAEFGPGDYSDIKFDIVAHSMGGLVARYFMRYGDADLPAEGLPELTWAGAELVERLVIVGTPNFGSCRATLQLVEGTHYSSILPSYGAALLGTMPSIYQLLPRPRHQSLRKGSEWLDVYDPAVWETHRWGLADPEQDDLLAWLMPDESDAGRRRTRARAHLALCLQRARQFHEALDRPGTPPLPVEMHLFASDAIDTIAILDVAPDGALSTGAVWPGDGTVLRSSALADERIGQMWQPQLQSPIAWRSTHFLFNDHLGMTRDPIFSDNVLYLLLEAPRARR